jgi:hypothetical protein
MAENGLERLTISPPVWPGKNLKVQPGDLTKFAPYGNGVYGHQPNNFEPIKGDPPQESSAGIVYFENGVKKEDFMGFLGMMGIRPDIKDYAAFISESKDPLNERFFKQLRIVPKFGLKYLFGTFFGGPRIEGKMGGDGDFAREMLGFGFMLENDYHEISRIWSRAWLVTK